MKRKEFTSKVKNVRDSIIVDLEKLSDDKDNLIVNVKNIKELTSIVKELGKIIEEDGPQEDMGFYEELAGECPHEETQEEIEKEIEQ